MRFTYDGKEYRIWFRHVSPRYTEASVGTLEEIEWMKTWPTVKPTYHAFARCHFKDNFCKETGRKMALARAIAEAPKEFRRAVWGCYIGRSRGAIQDVTNRLQSV